MTAPAPINLGQSSIIGRAPVVRRRTTDFRLHLNSARNHFVNVVLEGRHGEQGALPNEPSSVLNRVAATTLYKPV